MRSPRRAASALSVLAIGAAHASALAQAHAAEAPAVRVEAVELGAGIASLPDFPGSRTSSARLRPWADATIATARFGTFTLDSGSLTLAPALRWSPFDAQALAGASVLIGYRTGRDDRNPSLGSTNDGSDRLHGLPDVAGSADAGFEVHARPFGLPVFAIARHALHGAQGTIVDVGAYAPFALSAGAELTVLPTLGWNDAREARAWYGIDAPASAASGRPAYRPGAGWQRAALEVALDVPLAAHWHAVASVAALRLFGDAGASPIVERRWQPHALIGIAWHR